MQKFNIPVIWEMVGTVEVEAESLEDAKELALEGGIPDGYYIGDSMVIDEGGLYMYENA